MTLASVSLSSLPQWGRVVGEAGRVGQASRRRDPARPLAEPVIGPRFARTRWLTTALPWKGRDGA